MALVFQSSSPSPSPSPSPPRLTKNDSLEACINSRHSIRYFIPDPVPRATLNHCLALAQLAASNSNTQPWRLFLASGPARDRLKTALMAEAILHGPNIAPVPQGFQHFRTEFGKLLYGPDGYNIARDDTEGRTAKTLRNYEFFGASVVGVVCIPKVMGLIDALGVGMWAQTLLLALTAQGLGACMQVSVAGYPGVLRRELGIGDDLEILCGLAIGWPDWGKNVNKIVTERLGVEECVTFLEE